MTARWPWPWVLVMVVVASVASRLLERRYLRRHPAARQHLERQAWAYGNGRMTERGA